MTKIMTLFRVTSKYAHGDFVAYYAAENFNALVDGLEHESIKSIEHVDDSVFVVGMPRGKGQAQDSGG